VSTCQVIRQLLRQEGEGAQVVANLNDAPQVLEAEQPV
jgi:hypothetical protein